MQPNLRDPRPGDRVLIHAGALYDGSPVTEAVVKEAVRGEFFSLVRTECPAVPEVILKPQFFNLDPNSLR